MKKGTGIVTSVPSDSPDDYSTLRDLKNKPEWAAKFGITPEMTNFEVVPIIEIPGLGDRAAVTVVEEMKIKSHKDTKLLEAAKNKVYLKGFTEGVMIIGNYQGMKVAEAKQLVR